MQLIIQRLYYINITIKRERACVSERNYERLKSSFDISLFTQGLSRLANAFLALAFENITTTIHYGQ
jgi:hypothetical protein